MSNSAITFGQSTVSSSNIVWSEPVAFRNKIINGSFDIWQRGGSFNNALGAASYASDRWRCGSTGATSSFSISTDVPLGFRSSINCSDGGSSFGFIQQRIEPVNSFSLVNKTITLSFWVKTNTPSDVRAVLSFANALNDFTTVTDITTRNVSSQVTSGAWSFVTTSFTVPAGASNGLQIALYFNWGTAGGKSALFTGIQLEEGTIATPFEQRPIGTELALCQRYYEILSVVGNQGQPFPMGVYTSTTSSRHIWIFSVQKRAIPNSFSASSLWRVWDFVNTAPSTTTAPSLIEKTAFSISFDVYNLSGGITPVQYRPCFLIPSQTAGTHFISADAEL